MGERRREGAVQLALSIPEPDAGVAPATAPTATSRCRHVPSRSSAAKTSPATRDVGSGSTQLPENDNEFTGVHVSDGDPGPGGPLGAQVPKLGDGRWRWFYAQQHGDNPTYEVLLGGARER